MIAWSAVATFILLKFVGLFIPLRMSEENMEIGDTAEHGHEVYPSDIPSLGYPNGIPGLASGSGSTATNARMTRSSLIAVRVRSEHARARTLEGSQAVSAGPGSGCIRSPVHAADARRRRRRRR